jgi:hypothetical protein
MQATPRTWVLPGRPPETKAAAAEARLTDGARGHNKALIFNDFIDTSIRTARKCIAKRNADNY